jgi:glucose/mannose-6-phosphate isomerase
LSILDSPDRWSTIDPLGMRGLIESFPAQFRAAAAAAQALALPKPQAVGSIVVVGLGGSAIGGDIVRSVLGPSLRVPFLVIRDYALPGFVNPSSIVLACSYSGDTEETLSSYREARGRGAFLVAIASGGQLVRMAGEDGVPVVPLPCGMPPRAALGYSAIALFGCLTALGVAPDMREALLEAGELIHLLAKRYGANNPSEVNAAKSMAAALEGRVVAVYGGVGLLEPAAVRWRGQIEENAKNLALHHVLPEMNHNEILGWNCPEESVRRLAAVFLRDRGDSSQMQRRFDLTREIVRRRTDSVHEVWTEGESRLARLFSVIYMGDFVSLYLALLNGMDPVRIEAIDFLKRELAH